MMKYQQNYNFIPKEEIEEDLPIPDEKSLPTITEPRYDEGFLLAEIHNLKEQLHHSEKQLIAKEDQLLSIDNKVGELEYQLKKYESYQNEVQYLEDIKSKIALVNKENEELKEQIASYRNHVHTLYLVLLLLIIL